jgi:hypothetical protein
VSSESPWPNLFVVGASRAGTTSLWRYLGEHPDVFMTYFKEPHFFSGHRPQPYPVVHDEDAYLRLFAQARAPLRGEASPSYLWAEPAAARIKRVSPEAKILIALRDPVERSHSLYWHRARVGLEPLSFAETVAEQLEPGYPAERATYVHRICCAGDVARYLRLFDANVRVIVFEELIQDVGRELAHVFAFLRVDPAVAERIRPERHHPFVLPRSRFAARLLASERTRKAARAVVPYRLRWAIERRLVESRPKPPIDPETDRMLTEYFESDVRELTTLLGRRLPWPRWPAAIARPDPVPSPRAAGL